MTRWDGLAVGALALLAGLVLGAQLAQRQAAPDEPCAEVILQERQCVVMVETYRERLAALLQACGYGREGMPTPHGGI